MVFGLSSQPLVIEAGGHLAYLNDFNIAYFDDFVKTIKIRPKADFSNF